MFGETQSRILVSVKPVNLAALEAITAANNVPTITIGSVGGDTLSFGDSISLPLADVDDAWKNGFSRATSD